MSNVSNEVLQFLAGLRGRVAAFTDAKATTVLTHYDEWVRLDAATRQAEKQATGERSRYETQPRGIELKNAEERVARLQKLSDAEWSNFVAALQKHYKIEADAVTVPLVSDKPGVSVEDMRRQPESITAPVEAKPWPQHPDKRKRPYPEGTPR